MRLAIKRLAVLVGLLALAACASDAPATGPAPRLTIAWIPKALNNPVFDLGQAGALQRAAELTTVGPVIVEVQVYGSVAADAAEQARVVEDVIARGVDAIAISCNDPTACEDPIRKAVEAGIAVMTWDSNSPGSLRFTYLGVDNYQGGRQAAELLVNAMGPAGQVALLTGVPGAQNLEQRRQGFLARLADYPEIEIVATVASNDDINLGVQVVEEVMQSYPQLDGWFFVGMWPLFAERGSMPLWEAAARQGRIKTVAFDTLPVELDYLKDGYLSGLIGQKYWGWGYNSVKLIYDHVVGGQTFAPFTDSGMDIVTMANVQAMIDAWNNSDFSEPLPDPFPTP